MREAALRRGLVGPECLWTSLEVIPSTRSTNSDLLDRLRAGAATGEGQVLVAEQQTAGRGRLGRGWQAPARSGLFFSVLLRPGPDVPVARFSWLPLLTGVAVASAIAHTAGVDTALKWPNDLLVTIRGEERKFGGILAERSGDAVVIGVGINVTLRADELPVPTAASLSLAGAPVIDRDPLLRAVLRKLASWYRRWREAGGDAAVCRLQEAYVAGCATLGRTVRAELPGGTELVGQAVAIDGDGRLIVATAQGQQAVTAADVVHVRPDDAGDTPE